MHRFLDFCSCGQNPSGKMPRQVEEFHLISCTQMALPAIRRNLSLAVGCAASFSSDSSIFGVSGNRSQLRMTWLHLCFVLKFSMTKRVRNGFGIHLSTLFSPRFTPAVAYPHHQTPARIFRSPILEFRTFPAWCPMGRKSSESNIFWHGTARISLEVDSLQKRQAPEVVGYLRARELTKDQTSTKD